MPDTALSLELQAWRHSGHCVECDGVELFYRITAQDRNLPWLVCLHGFPTSSWDWHRLIPLLADRYRILVFDFPGYGFSAKPRYRDYSLLRQLDASEALLRHCEIDRFHLLAHDMGNSVACELLYRREQGNYPFSIESLTLLNGGVYMDLHRPLLTQRLLRTPGIGLLAANLSSWRVFRAQYPRVYAQPEQFSEAHYRDQWQLMLASDGRQVWPKIAGYMRERIRRGERWTGPLHRLELPFRIIWGQQDPIALVAIAQRLQLANPRADLAVLDGVGHYPQLEAPQQVAALM